MTIFFLGFCQLGLSQNNCFNSITDQAKNTSTESIYIFNDFIETEYEENIVQLKSWLNINSLFEMNKSPIGYGLNSEVNATLKVISSSVINPKAFLEIHYFIQPVLQAISMDTGAVHPEELNTQLLLDQNNLSIMSPAMNHGFILELNNISIEYVRNDFVYLFKDEGLDGWGEIEVDIKF